MWGTIIDVGGQAKNPTDVVRLCDIKPNPIEDETRRIRLQLPEVNDFFGGAFYRGSTYVIAGDPSWGKSTLLLQLVCGSGLKCRYVETEGESKLDIKERADRLGLGSAENVDVVEMENVIEAILEDNPYDVNIYDSLNAGLEGSHLWTSALKAIVDNSQENKTVSIVVGQVNGKGDAAGPAALRHGVTAVAFLMLDQESQIRTMVLDKNRKGPTAMKDRKTGVTEQLSLSFKMTSKGLKVIDHGP